MEVMIVINNTYSTKNKSIFHVSGRTYLRTEREGGSRIYDITGCKPRHDGTLDDLDGALLAFSVSAEEVADLAAKSEVYQERLARAEAKLREWVAFRETWSRKGKRKLSIKKKEVVKQSMSRKWGIDMERRSFK